MLDIRPTKMRILKLIALLFISMHLYACLFWKVPLPSPSPSTVHPPFLYFSSHLCLHYHNNFFGMYSFKSHPLCQWTNNLFVTPSNITLLVLSMQTASLSFLCFHAAWQHAIKVYLTHIGRWNYSFSIPHFSPPPLPCPPELSGWCQ